MLRRNGKQLNPVNSAIAASPMCLLRIDTANDTGARMPTLPLIFLRLSDGLADQARCREVHDCDDFVLCRYAREHSLVEKFTGDERAGNEITMAGRKIVVDDRMITGP